MTSDERQPIPDNELLPRHLTPEEIDDPHLVLDKFYDFAKLPQARESLWEILRAVVTSEYVKMNIKERSNLLFTYEQLQRLVEATYILHTLHRQERPGSRELLN